MRQEQSRPHETALWFFTRIFPGSPRSVSFTVSLLLVIGPLPRKLVACEQIPNANPQLFIKMPGLLSPHALLFRETRTSGGDEG